MRHRLILVAIILGSTMTALLLGIGIAYTGIYLAGSVEGFQAFMQRAAIGFLLWRVSLYGLGIYLYLCRYRPTFIAQIKQLRDLDDQRQALKNLRYLEYLMLGVIALIEAYNLGDWT